MLHVEAKGITDAENHARSEASNGCQNIKNRGIGRLFHGTARN